MEPPHVGEWIAGGLAWPYGLTRVVTQGKPGVGAAGRWLQLPAGVWVWLDARDGVAVLTSVTEADYGAVQRGSSDQRCWRLARDTSCTESSNEAVHFIPGDLR